MALSETRQQTSFEQARQKGECQGGGWTSGREGGEGGARAAADPAQGDGQDSPRGRPGR